jgi:hypothetical protein
MVLTRAVVYIGGYTEHEASERFIRDEQSL